jgi:hypothetical protein
MSTLESVSGVFLTLLLSGFMITFVHRVHKTESISDIPWRILVPSFSTSIVWLLYASSIHKVQMVLIGVVYLLSNGWLIIVKHRENSGYISGSTTTAAV